MPEFPKNVVVRKKKSGYVQGCGFCGKFCLLDFKFVNQAKLFKLIFDFDMATIGKYKVAIENIWEIQNKAMNLPIIITS